MEYLQECAAEAKKRVVVIGAGASGLTAIKACLEEGLDVVCYEKSDHVGGLWRYSDEIVQGQASVMKSTIINSSKEMSAFSDFPPAAHYPNYMHNSMMIKYIEDYAQHYKLTEYVKLKHEVLDLEPTCGKKREVCGLWEVTVKDPEGKTSSQVVDAVMVCSGHHVYPLLPRFTGQEKFKGRIIHTHDYKRPKGYEDRNIVVIGVGNSGGDVAVELSAVAKQVYLSTRRGAWIIHRVGRQGRPFDAQYTTRLLNWLFHRMPYQVVCWFCEYFINQKFDHAAYGLKPKHRIFGQHPMVNDALPNRILSGTVLVKGNIREIREHGIMFEDDREETPVDDIILATGYKVYFPFLRDQVLPVQENRVDAYRLVFPPDLPGLALIGLAQPIGALLPVSEIQSRWASRVFSGKLSLPSHIRMWEQIQDYHDRCRARYFAGPRNTLQIDWIDYLDEVAVELGVKPNVPKIAIKDPVLGWHLTAGPSLSYQYRLEGPNPWPGAREAILTYEERVRGALETRKVDTTSSKDLLGTVESLGTLLLGAFFMLCLAYLAVWLF
ncbi:flavin-containing monooxygenase 5-like [Ornithodoros turicata]|uniref:flavin-containing monooxygenase 5-like n=1 Tax=Ornithodoros turicata TaxID=34597 RepID=UPI00313A49F2